VGQSGVSQIPAQRLTGTTGTDTVSTLVESVEELRFWPEPARTLDWIFMMVSLSKK
jgi:hypothetical protein